MERDKDDSDEEDEKEDEKMYANNIWLYVKILENEIDREEDVEQKYNKKEKLESDLDK